MKKSLLALVVLGAFASAASAQSSVTIYGKLDQGFGKEIGSGDKSVREAGNSRLGFRGNEDLGGGLNAIFSFEHRFKPDEGTSTAAIFWQGHSYVGLSHNTLGALTIGRQFTSAYLVQDNVDPFAGDGVAGLRGIGMGTSITDPASVAAFGAVGQASPAQTRIPNSVKYRNSFSGFTVAADVGEHVATVAGDDKPFSVGLTYGAGPLWLGLSYEDASGADDRLINAGAKYTFGVVTLSAGIADGRVNLATDNKLRGYLVGANVAVGAGDIKVGWANQKLDDVNVNSRVGLGYHHNLSKRTKLYASVAREQKILTSQKNGYELGLQHNF